MVFGLSVAAGAIPAFETFLEHMGGDLRQLLQPINKMAADNGIQMDVVAAVNDGHTAVVYLTLQDMENKGRIDNTTRLTEVTANSGFGGFERQVHYDTETGAATFRL